MPKVSVISPVYGVENFIRKAVESMFSQTLRDVEFIFVDDCSPDKSIAIIQDVMGRFPSRESQVKIICHSTNMGLPSARNTGIAHAEGEYIFHWDSDDYADPTMLEDMYSVARKGNYDIVWTDWYLTFEKNERYMKQPEHDTPMEALKAMLGGAMKYNVWNKLAKRSLYTEYGIRFPDGRGMGEDMTMMLLFTKAKRVKYINSAYYHYLKTNTKAFSHRVNEKYFDSLKANVTAISDKLYGLYGDSITDYINFLKLESKYPLISATSDFTLYRLWNDWFPEANEYIIKNHFIGKRSMLLQLLAKRKLYWLIWLHFQLVSKVVYGVIFK